MTRNEIIARAARLRNDVAELRRTKVSIWNPQPLADRLARLADDTLGLIQELAAAEGDTPGDIALATFRAPEEDTEHGGS